MSDIRKKIVAVGWLFICIASMAHASNERESPSLGWMMALGATWFLGVWLWERRWTKTVLSICAITSTGVALIPLMVFLGQCVFFLRAQETTPKLVQSDGYNWQVFESGEKKGPSSNPYNSTVGLWTGDPNSFQTKAEAVALLWQTALPAILLGLIGLVTWRFRNMASPVRLQ